MAILRVDFDGLRAAPRATDARPGGAGPVTVMIHGFKYDPRLPCADPHRTLYGDGPTPEAEANRGRAQSWPHQLGVADAIAYGWPARASGLATLLGEGRGAFAAVYARAGAAGAALAAALETLAPGRPVDVVAHSLGARVALSALRAAADGGGRVVAERFGRLILLGPAEFGREARAALAACDAIGARPPEVYCLLARRNAAYDRLFEAFAPWGRGPSLGRAGLGERRARWIDLAFDDPGLPGWAARLGVDLAPPAPGACHWDFYTRPGAMALHRAILNRAGGTAPEEMRAAGAPLHQPRARRRLRAPLFGSPGAGPTPAAA